MTKLCSVCATENRDEAQFCRSCGTSLPSASPLPADEATALAAGIVCAECAFQNKPGVRFCANCGVSLLAGAAAPAPPSSDDPFSGLSASPPPLSYPSFAPVGPYPPAPAPIDLQDWAGAPATDSEVAALGHDGYPPDDAYPPHSGVDTAVDIPDADLSAAPREQQIFAAENAPPAGAPNRGPLVIGAIATVLVLAGAAGWWFTSGPSGSPPAPASVAIPLPPPTALPTPTVPPLPPLEAASATVATPGLASSMPLSTVAPGEVIVAPGSVASGPTPTALETTPVTPSSETDNEAKRLAAEKLRREKIAREKIEREAKAKNEQRDQAAAAAARAATARAEQDALTRRRAEEAVRQRSLSVTPNPAATAQPQVRGVKDICAGRGTIAEAICQSRECGASEHANEAICRQIREAEERRRYYTN